MGLLKRLTSSLGRHEEAQAAQEPVAQPQQQRRPLSAEASLYAPRRGQLDDHGRANPQPAIGSLLDHTRAALDEAGDTALVTDQVERLLARGNGATQQRRTFERTGSLADVVSEAVARTEASWSD